MRARTTEGTAIEAFGRLVPECFALQRVIMLAFGGEDVTQETVEECGPAAAPSTRSSSGARRRDGRHQNHRRMGAAAHVGRPLRRTYMSADRVYAHEALTLCLYSLIKAVGPPERA